MIEFSYCLDAAGNLIKLNLNEHPDALIPGSVEMVTSASELEHPLPWTKSVADAVNEVRFVPYPHVAGTAAQTIHDSRKLPQSTFVFVPPSPDFADESEVMELIGLYDKLPEGSTGRIEIEAALGAVGIQPIPLLAHFIPDLYSGQPLSTFSAIAQYGWISHSKVYRKAQVI